MPTSIPSRGRVIAVLAGVLALQGSDKGTVATTASNLEHAFGVGNTQIGLLVTASTLVAAVGTLPMGALTDRVNRTRLLGGSIVLWSLATAVSGAAQSFLWLLLSRVALGAVTATAGPAIASLSGDFFPAVARARLYGFVLGGEFIGTGIGFVGSGFLAQHLGWRAGFWWLAVPGLVLAVAVARLGEPARGGQTPLDTRRDAVAGRVGERADIHPYAGQVLTEDPAGKGLWWATRYILRVRTNVVVIVASTLGYFYLTGVTTFAVLFAQRHYAVSKTEASSLVLVLGVGGLIGVYAGGRAADTLLGRGVVAARILVPGVVLLAVAPVLAPAFWLSSLWVGLPLLTLGTALLSAANPPQDAVRLDIIHPHLWGRSEGVRTASRGLLDAAAPLTFGWVSDTWFGGDVHSGATAAAGSQHALGLTFLVFLVVLTAAGLIVMLALRTYPRDVATATASLRGTLRRATDRRDPGEGAAPAR